MKMGPGQKMEWFRPGHRKEDGTVKRWFSGIMASVMLVSSVVSAFPAAGWAGGGKPGDTIVTGAESHPGYCIDSYELLGQAGGILGGVGETYTCVLPSSRLSINFFSVAPYFIFCTADALSTSGAA